MFAYSTLLVLVQLPCMFTMYEQSPRGPQNIVKINFTNSANKPYYCLFCDCRDVGKDHIVNCSRLGMFQVPNHIGNETTVLVIQNNRIFKLKNSSFEGLTALRILILAHNVISRIETGAFASLVSLEYLDLSENNLVTLRNVLKPGMFLSLQKLRGLYIQHNVNYLKQNFFGIPEYPIVELKSLECLYIDGFVNASFGIGYTNLTKLTNISMSGSLGYCELEYITKVSFQNVPSVKYLFLDNCRLKYIDEDAFLYIQNLTYLDLSWNFELGFTTFGKAAYGLKFTMLRELKINAIHNPYRAGSELLRGHMRNIKDLKVETLHMDDNGIEYVDYGVSKMLPKTLKFLTLRKNRLHFGIYLSQLVFNNPSLVLLDAGDQEIIIRTDLTLYNTNTGKRNRRDVGNPSDLYFNKLYYRREMMPFNRMPLIPKTKFIDKDGIQRTEEMTRGFDQYSRSLRVSRNKRQLFGYENTKTVPLNLETLICSGSRADLHLLNYSGIPNNITVIDISRNFIPEIHEDAFKGLDKLQLLNLSYNYVEHLHSNGFNGLENLNTLDLSGNLLGYEIRTDIHSNKFSHFHVLMHLNLSNNRITRIPFMVFGSLTHVESLNLKYNYIEQFDVSLVNLADLRILDLSENKIPFLSREVRNSLDIIAEKHEISVSLEGNKLLCNCETVIFLEWLVSTDVDMIDMDNYYCSLNNGTIRYLNRTEALLEQLHTECKTYLELIIVSTTGITFIMAFLLFYVTYRNRWKLRYMYYMAKLKLDINPNGDNQDHNFQFDVFISYADGDRNFVITNVIEELEETAGLRLVIRDRDYEIGESIAINISKAVRNSKRTILLLSRHFIKSKWCDFELNMARMESIHTQRDVIVMIVLETIPPNMLPLAVMDLLRSSPNIDWPKDINTQRVFWDRCITLLKA